MNLIATAILALLAGAAVGAALTGLVETRQKSKRRGRLGSWTLDEVQQHCKKQEGCVGCTLWPACMPVPSQMAVDAIIADDGRD